MSRPFAETLAGFRPRASMVGAFSPLTPEAGRVLPGQVPAAWLDTRRLRTFDVMGSLPFVDIESPATHAYLTEHAATVLLHQGLENLDVAAVRGPSRLLTRAIASWLYSTVPTNMHSRSTRGSATCPGSVTSSAGRFLTAHQLRFARQPRWIRRIKGSGR